MLLWRSYWSRSAGHCGTAGICAPNATPSASGYWEIERSKSMVGCTRFLSELSDRTLHYFLDQLYILIRSLKVPSLQGDLN